MKKIVCFALLCFSTIITWSLGITVYRKYKYDSLTDFDENGDEIIWVSKD